MLQVFLADPDAARPHPERWKIAGADPTPDRPRRQRGVGGRFLDSEQPLGHCDARLDGHWRHLSSAWDLQRGDDASPTRSPDASQPRYQSSESFDPAPRVRLSARHGAPRRQGGGLGATAGAAVGNGLSLDNLGGSVTRSPLAGMSPPKELARRSSEARPASAHYAALPDLIRGPRRQGARALPSDMRFRDRSPEDRRRMTRALTGALHTPCAPRERSIPLGRFAGATPAEDEARVERDDVGVWL